MEKELYEQKPNVDAQTLSDVLNEKEACPFNKTLMEIYGLATPTSEILDYIHDQKISTTYLIFAIFMFTSCVVPIFIMDILFYSPGIGVLIMLVMIFVGVLAIIKGNTISKNSNYILADLEMCEEDYNMVADSYEKYKKQQNTFVTLAVGLFVFSVFPVVIVEELFYSYAAESLGVASMFLMISSGVSVILYQLKNKSIFKKLLRYNKSIYE